MTNDTQVRDFLHRMANEIDVTSPDPRRPVKRARRHRSVSLAAVVVIVAAIVATGSIGVRWLTETPPKPAEEPTQGPVPPGTRPVFERTATIGGLTVTSPSDWFLVDYWGDWNPDGTSLDTHAIALLEVTNFDPGLSTPVCAVRRGDEPTRLPFGGVAIFVMVGDGEGSAADLCGGNVARSSTGTVGSAAFTSVMTVGADVTEAERATADQIWRSMAWNDRLSFYGRERSPRYVLDGWRDSGSASLLEALPSTKNVELSLIQVGPTGIGGDEISDVGVPQPNPIEGGTFGAVTEDATAVEYRHAGVETPLRARLIDLPPSLHAAFDAYVFEPQPTGGPSEVTAIGPDGSVLGSNLPPLVNTARVGTVQAFGTTWTVKRSTAADGYWAATCVEPAATATLAPCERAPGDGLLVQAIDGRNPAVFVTEEVGDTITAIELLADDGRVFHAVMVPTGRGSVAVIALEGAGSGRLVYHLSDGQTDQGRRPEAQVAWPDLGQVIGNGSFPPPGTA